jgi:hypothetical protein
MSLLIRLYESFTIETAQFTDTYIQAIYSVTRSFDDHYVSRAGDSNMATTVDSQYNIFTNLGAGFKRAFPSPGPDLPIVSTAISSSTRGILDKSKQEGELSEVVSIARSVHFSPNTSRQSSGFTESKELENTLGLIDQNGSLADPTPPESSSSLEEGNARINRVVNSNGVGPERHGRVMISRVGRRGASIANQGLSFH